MRACPSCGNETDQPSYCEQCGAALTPVDAVEDTALSLMLGLVCTQCDSYNEPQTDACVMCGANLEESLPNRPPSTSPPAGPPAWMSAPDGAPLKTADALPAVDLAALKAEPEGMSEPLPELEPVSVAGRCQMCGQGLEPDDKFCRHCGTPADADARSTMRISTVGGGVGVGQPGPAATQVLAALNPASAPAAQAAGGPATLFLGAVNVQRLARLVLIKGASDDGAQWRLSPGETTIGAAGAIQFSNDPHLAEVQCRVLLSDAGLELHPVEPHNGVFVSIANKVQLAAGDEFVVGTQRLLLLEDDARQPALPSEQDGTALLGAMMPGPPNILLRRVFESPGLEEVYVRAQRLLTLGRSLCDINFPRDPYLSVRHAQLARSQDGYVLEDLGSRNGTYVRVRRPHLLKHGDAIMVGDQVLRVELSA